MWTHHRHSAVKPKKKDFAPFHCLCDLKLFIHTKPIFSKKEKTLKKHDFYHTTLREHGLICTTVCTTAVSLLKAAPWHLWLKPWNYRSAFTGPSTRTCSCFCELTTLWQNPVARLTSDQLMMEVSPAVPHLNAGLIHCVSVWSLLFCCMCFGTKSSLDVMLKLLLHGCNSPNPAVEGHF